MPSSTSLSRARRLPLVAFLVALACAVSACTSGASTVTPASSRTTGSPTAPAARWQAAKPPAIKHVFVVNLENKSFTKTFGAHSQAPYLSRTLRRKGMLLSQFYGVAHFSLPNYLAQISGQGPNPATQLDCAVFSRFRRTGRAAPQQLVGQGCVYPPSVHTIADQLGRAGLSWRGYMEDMGTGCRHPALGARDRTQKARVGDQYAARHDPFVYFRRIIDARASCAHHVVDLSRLRHDLRSVAHTRSLSYITPNLCDDAHDAPCVDGRPGGLTSANLWLRRWVPRVLHSAAFRRDGLLVVTFDEAEVGGPEGSTSCCGNTSTPNTDSPGRDGPGGGRIGAVLLSPYLTGGSTSAHPYNQYSLLRSVEDVFGLGHLGYARTAQSFGRDVWG